MPASSTVKRKANVKDSKASSAKKPKMNGNQKKPSTPASKKTPAKLTTVKSKTTPKSGGKQVKSPVKKAEVTKSKANTKKTVVKNNPSKPTIKGSKTSVTRAKLVAAKSKAQSAAQKAKAKALKTNTKPSVQKGRKLEIKKPKVVPSKQKLEKPKTSKEGKKKPVQKKDVEENAAKKRKAVENTDESDETPRKRRIITPNKKYADFEVSTVSPKRVSELRSFLQDKRKPSPAPAKKQEAAEKPEKQTPAKPTPTKKQTPKPKAKVEDDLEEDVRLIKASEMKPAEKLMKKLQKKLEKEAKAASTFKQKDESEKTKITKVVTYNKPKTKISSLPIKSLAQSPKTPKSKVPTGVVKPQLKEAKSKEKVTKAAPKSNQTPEKVVKPKKIKELKREDRPIQVKLAYQKNIKDKDEQKCWITGIDTFPSGEIIMVDMANKKIKLFNKTIDECLSCIKLDTIPQDISVSPVDASSAYFTKPFSKEGIQKISMSDGKLTLKESLFTNGTNRGIKCTKAGILTSVQDGRYHDLDINCFKIDLLDYEGKSLKTVSVDQTGTRLFKLPLYFTTSSNDKQVVVSDCIRNNSYIVSLDLTGKIKFKYTGLLAPRGLTVDNNDNVYVTEWEQNNVYVLSPTGKRLQVLITNQECQNDGMDGLTKPYQLCFIPNESHGQLLVSQEGSDTIKVFNISKLEKTEAEKTEAQTASASSPKKAVNGKAGAEKTEEKAEAEKFESEKTDAPTASPKKAEAEKAKEEEDAEVETTGTSTASTTESGKDEEVKQEETKEEKVEENKPSEEIASTSSS